MSYTQLRIGPAQVDALLTALPEYIADYEPAGPDMTAADRRIVAALDRLYKRLSHTDTQRGEPYGVRA